MPSTILWFRIYCGLLCALYLAVAGAGIAFLVVSPETLEMDSASAKLLGILFLGMGGGMTFLSFLGFFMPQRPGAWTYCLMLIVLGLTSLVFLPISLPLLISWLKPQTQEWFGRNVS